MFKNSWKLINAQAEQSLSILKLNLKNLDKKIEDLLYRIIETNSAKVISVYETKIEDLEEKRYMLSEKIQNLSVPNKKANKFIELSMQSSQTLGIYGKLVTKKR